MQLTLSKQSLIIRVATYGGLVDTSMTNLCSVFWRFMWGMGRAPFWTTLIGSLGATFIFFLVFDPIITFLVWLETGVWLDPFKSIVQAIAWSGIFFVAHLAWMDYRNKTSPVLEAISSTTDVVRAGYRGWKEKTCVLVNVN